MEKLNLINGNGQDYSVALPKIFIHIRTLNEVALDHIFNNTGLWFEKDQFGYSAQPHASDQIVRLFLTYNYKTQYYNNSTFKNELHLKSDHHIGFNVDSICFECAKHNRLNINGLNKGDRLSC